MAIWIFNTTFDYTDAYKQYNYTTKKIKKPF